MNRLHKGVALALCLSLTAAAGLYTVQARHHKPLHNGDYVFDAKRFADSVKETAQQALVASKKAQELSIRALNHAGLSGVSPTVLAALDRYQESFTGTELSSADDLARSPMREQPNYDPFSGELGKDIQSYLQKVHTNTLQLERSVLAHKQQRMKDVRTIADTETQGQMGELQKHASLAVLSGMDAADDARVEGAQMAADIAEDEAQWAMERNADQQQRIANHIAAADPYNPTASDLNHRPAIDNFGFLSTQRTE